MPGERASEGRHRLVVWGAWDVPRGSGAELAAWLAERFAGFTAREAQRNDDFAVLFARDATGERVALDAEPQRRAVFAGAAIDWYGGVPRRRPTHRVQARCRSRGPSDVEITVLWRSPELPPDEPARVPCFWVEVALRAGEGEAPFALRDVFERLIEAFEPTNGYLESVHQEPSDRFVHEARVGLFTFVPRARPLGAPIEGMIQRAVGELGWVVGPGLDQWDDAPPALALRERAAWTLLPVLQGRVAPAAAPAPSPPVSQPVAATPSYLKAPSGPAPPPPPSLRLDVGRIPCFFGEELRAGTVEWIHEGVLCLSSVVNATFALRNGEATPSRPEPLRERDHFLGNHLLRSLLDPLDMVPYLPRGQVLVLGSVEVPRGKTQRVRLAVSPARPGERGVDKTLLARGDLAPAGASAVMVGLHHENAFGGASVPDNPVGKAEPLLVDPVDPRRVACFGAVSPTFQPRAQHLGHAVRKQLAERPVVVPPGFVWEALLAAPEDQRMGGYFGGERLVLEGARIAEPRIETWLPQGGVQSGLFRAGHLLAWFPMALDTLRVDLDRRVLVATYRGYLRVPGGALDGTEVVGAALVGSHEGVTWPSSHELEQARLALPTATGKAPVAARAAAPGSAAGGTLPIIDDDATVGLEHLPPPVAAPTPFIGGSASDALARALASSGRPAGALEGEDLGGTAIAPSVVASEALPFGPSSSAQALPLEQYARVFVELRQHPEREAAVLARYSLASAAALRVAEADWKERFKADPGLRSQWIDVCDRYRAWLAQNPIRF